MPGGSSSLFGFVYQLFLSLVVLFDNPEKGLFGMLEVIASPSLPVMLDAASNPVPVRSAEWDRALRAGDAVMRVALEGHSDIDNYLQNRRVRYIQAKAHPESGRAWTPAPLFHEVLQKLPDTRGAPAGSFSYLLVTDTELNGECQRFLAVCRWLAQVSDSLPADATDADWQKVLATVEDAGLTVTFSRAGLWKNQRLVCRARDLPQRLTELQALARKTQSSASEGEEAGRKPSRIRPHPQPFTLAETARFLAAFDIAPQMTFHDLTTRLTERLQDFVPRESVPGIIDNLLRVALEFATQKAGQTTTSAEFLDAVGIHGEPYRFSNIVAACQRLVAQRSNQFVLPSDIPVTAPREHADRVFARFLSSTRWKIFTLVGEPKVGKSRQLTEWARREGNKLPTLLVHARSFAWESIAESIHEALGHEGITPQFSTQGLMARLQALRPTDPTVFLLCVDALDEAATVLDLEDRLRVLWQHIQTLPIKVALTCKSSEWHRYTHLFKPVQPLCFPPDQTTEQLNQYKLPTGNRLAASQELLLLTSPELGTALLANALFVPSAHVAEETRWMTTSIRTLSNPLLQQLSHPAFLNIYYQLKDQPVAETHAAALYAVVLYERYWNQQCQQWAKAANGYEEDMNACLRILASAIRQAHISDGTLDVSAVERLPFTIEMQWRLRVPSSPAQQAKELGILRDEEAGSTSDGRKIAFGPAYLLEYALMQELASTLPAAAHLPQTDAQELFQAWLSAIVNEIVQHNFDPLFYALAFLLQSLCLTNSTATRDLLRGMLLHYHALRLDLFFAFVADVATPHLAALIENEEHGIAWQAAVRLGQMGTRMSDQALIKLLHHPQEEVRGYALQQVRAHPRIAIQDITVVHRLITLPDADPEVNSTWVSEAEMLPDTLEQIAYSDLNAGRREVLAALEQHLGHADAHICLRCAKTLGRVAHRSCLPALRQAFQQARENPDLALALGAAISSIGAQEDVSALLSLVVTTRPVSRLSIYHWGYILATLVERHWEQARATVEGILAHPQEESPRILEKLMGALARCSASETALDFLEKHLNTEDLWARSEVLRSIGMQGTPRSNRMLLQALVHDFAVWEAIESTTNTSTEIKEALEAATHHLCQILGSLSRMQTLEEMEAIFHLRLSDPTLWTAVETVAFRLTVAEEHHFVHLETRRGAHWLLVALGSSRLEEAWWKALTRPKRDMHDVYWKEELCAEIACLSTTETLPFLVRFERTLRTPPDDLKPRISFQVTAVAQALAAAGGSDGYSAWLNVLRFYDELDSRAVDAVALIKPEYRDAGPLVEIAMGGPQFRDSERVHAVCALRTMGVDGLGSILNRILQSDPYEVVRIYAASGLGYLGFREAIPTLRTERARSQGRLLDVCTEALCRLGCQDTVRDLLRLHLRPATSDAGNRLRESLLWLALYPEADALAEEIDHLLVTQMRVPSYWVRSTAMAAFIIRHYMDRPLVKAVTALSDFLRQERWAGQIHQDDRTAPSVLAKLSPRAFCEITNNLDLAGWHVDGRLALVKALGRTRVAEAVPALTLLLEDPAYCVRRCAARYLAVHSETITKPLLEGLAARDAAGAMYAAEALLWFDATWAEELRNALNDHPDGRVRRRIQQITIWRQLQQTDHRLLQRCCHAATPKECWLYGRALQDTNELIVSKLKKVAVWEETDRFPYRYLVAHRCLPAATQQMAENALQAEKEWRMR